MNIDISYISSQQEPETSISLMDLGTQAGLDGLLSAPQYFFLLCVYPPGRSRKYCLSHFHILEFLEPFLTTLIQSSRPEMEFRNVRRVTNIAEMKVE